MQSRYAQMHSAADALKAPSKRAIQKTAEANDDFIGSKTVDDITKVSKRSTQSSSEKVENKTENTKFDREIPKER